MGSSFFKTTKPGTLLVLFLFTLTINSVIGCHHYRVGTNLLSNHRLIVPFFTSKELDPEIELLVREVLITRSTFYGIQSSTSTTETLTIKGEITRLSDRPVGLLVSSYGTLTPSTFSITLECYFQVYQNNLLILDLHTITTKQFYLQGTSLTDTEVLRKIAIEHAGVEMADQLLTTILLTLMENKYD